ncbi:MAG: macro domain-containing protein, partial [Ignavibacteriales bacterium]|nr:macro domain-containing protein [Ignavibacteriales bacterium]
MHRAGGPRILEECRALRAARGGARAGPARRSSPARVTFPAASCHPRGRPRSWHGGDRGEPETLAACYRACLELAEEHRLRVAGLPEHLDGRLRLSRGPGRAARLSVVAETLARATRIRRVRFVLFSEADLAVYAAALAALRQAPTAGLAEAAQGLLEPAQPGVEVLPVDHDLELAVRQAPHATRVAGTQRDHDRLPVDPQAVGDLEDPLHLPHREVLESCVPVTRLTLAIRN